MRGRGLALTAAGVLAVALFAASGLAGCGVVGERDAHVVNPDDVPFDLLAVEAARPGPANGGSSPAGTGAPGPEPDGPAAAEVAVVYLVADDRLAAVPRPGGGDDAARLLALLVQEPSAVEAARGLRSAIGSPDLVAGVTVAGDTATVDLTEPFVDTAPPDQRLALAQLTYTLTEPVGITQVVFTLGGEPTSVPRADGTTTDGPVTRADYRTLGP